MPPSPYVERASFGSYPKAFELLKGHLAVSLRTQTSAFGRMRELPSEAVRENTDRQTSSPGCKIRQNIHPKTGRNDAKSCHNDATSCHVAEKRYKYRHFVVYLHRQTKRRQSICRLVERDSCPNSHWLVATDTWLSVSPAVSPQGELAVATDGRREYGWNVKRKKPTNRQTNVSIYVSPIKPRRQWTNKKTNHCMLLSPPRKAERARPRSRCSWRATCIT